MLLDDYQNPPHKSKTSNNKIGMMFLCSNCLFKLWRCSDIGEGGHNLKWSQKRQALNPPTIVHLLLQIPPHCNQLLNPKNVSLLNCVYRLRKKPDFTFLFFFLHFHSNIFHYLFVEEWHCCVISGNYSFLCFLFHFLFVSMIHRKRRTASSGLLKNPVDVGRWTFTSRYGIQQTKK